ncbi:zinc transporter ZntB [Microbulbifer sp. CNSA002]|uniref:zinc transporter ZntB n=1 Tax=unclassified Microbulbifer TaxID=2619833 RepID=UPI0039B5DB2C
METGLVYAVLLDRKGSGRELSWAEVKSWQPDQGILWLHFDYDSTNTVEWLQQDSGLTATAIETLSAKTTRPCVMTVDQGLMLAMYGIERKSKPRAKDMIAIRIWAEENRIISTGRRKLLSEDDLLSRLRSGFGPRGTAALLMSLADLLVLRMCDRAEDFEEKIDDLENLLLDKGGSELSSLLVRLRKRTIVLRRYLCLQREVLGRLQQESLSWFDEHSHALLGEVNDRLQRHIDDIDAVRERAAIAQEELLSRTSDQLNSRMYVLSVVAAVFLPLSFLTGLFGINVGGIPWGQSSLGFIAFCILLVVALAGQVALFYWKKWL